MGMGSPTGCLAGLTGLAGLPIRFNSQKSSLLLRRHFDWFECYVECATLAAQLEMWLMIDGLKTKSQLLPSQPSAPCSMHPVPVGSQRDPRTLFCQGANKKNEKKTKKKINKMIQKMLCKAYKKTLLYYY